MAWQNQFVPNASQRVISIDNGGVWTPGNTYTVTWYLHWWRITWTNEILYRLAPVMELNVVAQQHYRNIRNIIFSTYTLADSYAFKSSPTGQFFDDSQFELYGSSVNTSIDADPDTTSLLTLDGVSADLGGIDPSDAGNGYASYLIPSTFKVASNTTPGTYVLAYMGFEITNNGGNTYIEKQRIYYPITITDSSGSIVGGFPKSRPDNYDPDDYYDPTTENWTSDPTDLTTLGGGRYRKQIVVVSNQGNIYVGSG